MNSKTLNHSRRIIAAAVTIMLTFAMSSMAADVWMTAGDGFGTSSFDSGANWSDGTAPSTANQYFTSNQILRTDTTISNSVWQGGDLTIMPGGSVYNKFNLGVCDFSGPLGTTILTNMGTLANAFAPDSICTFKGNMYVPLQVSTNTTGFNPALGSDNTNTDLYTVGCSFDDQSGNQNDNADIRYLTNDMTMFGVGYVTNHNSYNQPASPPPPGYIIYTGNNTQFYGSLVIESNTILSALSEDNLFGNPSSFRSNLLYMDGGVFQLYSPTNTNGVIDYANLTAATTNFVLDRANGGIWISPAGGQFDIPPGFTLTNAMALGGSGRLTLTNTGTFVCAGSASNFTGELDVNIGTLIMGTANALEGPYTISVGPGGTFDASAAGMTFGSGQTLVGNGSISGTVTFGAGATFSPGGDGNAANFGVGGLTLNDGSTIDEDFTLTTNDVINISGNLTLSGTVDLKLNSLPPVSGTYTLMTIGGTVTGTTANFAVKTLVTRGSSVTLQFTATTPKQLQAVITVAPPANLTWDGSVSSIWDLTNSANWLDNGTNDVYYDLDKVTFTDAGAAVQPTLNMTVNPGAVTFSSSTNYTLSGSGQIAGPVALVQNGTGTTTISTTNTYSGGTIISNGVLRVGNVGTTNFLPVGQGLGNPSTTLAVVSGHGTLDIGGNPLDNTYTVPVQISGNGYNGRGAVDNSVGGFSSGSGDMGIGTLELTGNATIGASANWQIGLNGEGIVGNGYTLTKIAGPGGATNGPTNNLVYLSASSTNNPPGSFVIAGGGVVFWNVADAVGALTPITLTNAGFIDTWDPAGNFAGLTFNNPIIVNDANRGGEILNFRPPTFNTPPSDVFNGNVYLQAGTLIVSNVNTFTGPTFGRDTFNGNISGPGGITAVGGFTFIGISNPYGGNQVNLNGLNSYTGPTKVYYGAYLNTSTASQGGGSYMVTDGGTLDVQVVPGYPTMPMSSLSVSDGFTAGYGANISFIRLAQMPTVPVIYATNFTTSYNFIANTTIFPPGAGYTIGQFPLIKYNGSIQGSGFSDLQLAPLPGGVTGYLSNNVTAHTVDLVVTAAGKAWFGGVNSNWDIGTLNWTNPATASTVTFADGDTATFNDSAANYNVILTRTNTVAGITVNATNNYTWTNNALGGIIAGNGALTKLGSGTLTIGVTNQLAGGTYIYGGTIKLANRGSLGRDGQDVYVDNGGTLDLNNWKVPNSSGFTPNGLNVYINGSGVGGNGALINSQTLNPTNDSSQTLGENYADAGPVTLLGSATVGGAGDVNVGGGTQAHLNSVSSTNVLTKVGSGKFRIRGATTVSTNFGLINILGGIVSYESSSQAGLGDPTKNILVGSGAGFAWGTPAALQIAPVASVRPLICSNNSTLYGWNNPTNDIESPVTLVSGNVTLSGVLYTNGVVQDSYHGLVFSNVISGSGGVTVDQQSLITFAAANTYSGNTIVSSSPTNTGGTAASVLSLVGNGSINSSPSITLLGGSNPTNANGAYGAILAVTNRSDHTLTLVSGQTLRGDDGSAVAGDVIANIGATITPGGGGNIQYMTFDNNLTLSSGSTVAMDVSMDGAGSNDVINVTGTNNYAGTLQIANVGGTPLVAGDSFQLFNNGQYTGTFATVSGALGSGLSWSFDPATGIATVVSTSSGPVISWSRTGNQLTLTWDGSYIGYTLQAQTNKLNSTGINPTNNWFNVVGTSTVGTNVQTITTNSSVFYRLHQ